MAPTDDEGRAPRSVSAPCQFTSSKRVAGPQTALNDGKSQPESMVKSWDRAFQKIGAAADPTVADLEPDRRGARLARVTRRAP
jgi:hypothetical protein